MKYQGEKLACAFAFAASVGVLAWPIERQETRKEALKQIEVVVPESRGLGAYERPLLGPEDYEKFQKDLFLELEANQQGFVLPRNDLEQFILPEENVDSGETRSLKIEDDCLPDNLDGYNF